MIVLREDDSGVPLFCLVKVHLSVGRYDDEVAYMHFMGGGSVDADDARSGRTLDGIGAKTFSIGDVIYFDPFVFYDVGGFHKVAIYCDAANIVEVGFGDSNSVNFRLEDFN